MSIVHQIKIKSVLEVVIAIFSIPIVVSVLYVINLLGVYFGSFIREISLCIK